MLDYIGIILTGIALSMDAMAIAITQGLKGNKSYLRNAIIVAVLFGLFQALMPLIGYHVGSFFSDKIADYDHYFAFGLLSVIGIKMLINKSEEESQNNNFQIITIIILAIATSIDALIVGVSFALTPLTINILIIVAIIGVITFALCLIGGLFGKKLTTIVGKNAEKIGGIILILLAFKILIEHLFF